MLFKSDSNIAESNSFNYIRIRAKQHSDHLKEADFERNCLRYLLNHARWCIIGYYVKWKEKMFYYLADVLLFGAKMNQSFDASKFEVSFVAMLSWSVCN